MSQPNNDPLMTLRRAIRLFMGAWMPWPDEDKPTFQEWLLACAVIDAAIELDGAGKS